MDTAYFVIVALNIPEHCKSTELVYSLLKQAGFESTVMDREGNEFPLPAPFLSGEFMATSADNCKLYIESKIAKVLLPYKLQVRIVTLICSDLVCSVREILPTIKR